MITTDVKEFLMRYRNANREINAKLDEILKLRELSVKTTAVLGGDKVQTSVGNTTEKIVAEIVDLENEVGEAVDGLREIKHEVENVIEAVPAESQRAVLKLRYINCETWEEIAEDLDYTYRHVLRLHNMALKAMNDVLVCPVNL